MLPKPKAFKPKGKLPVGWSVLVLNIFPKGFVRRLPKSIPSVPWLSDLKISKICSYPGV